MVVLTDLIHSSRHLGLQVIFANLTTKNDFWPCCWSKTLIKKTERKNVGKFQRYAPLIYGRHLEHQTPS
jgi:hypothetical protein